MNMEEQARELMAQKRQHREHLQESMLNRVEAEVQQGTNATTDELAREQLVQQRQESEHIDESMLTRTEAELGVPHDTSESSQQQS